MIYPRSISDLSPIDLPKQTSNQTSKQTSKQTLRPYTMDIKLHDLITNGYTVLSIDWMDVDKREKLRGEFKRTLKSFPEFNDDAKDLK